jgi:hypothetical protein
VATLCYCYTYEEVEAELKDKAEKLQPKLNEGLVKILKIRLVDQKFFDSAFPGVAEFFGEAILLARFIQREGFDAFINHRPKLQAYHNYFTHAAKLKKYLYEKYPTVQMSYDNKKKFDTDEIMLHLYDYLVEIGTVRLVAPPEKSATFKDIAIELREIIKLRNNSNKKGIKTLGYGDRYDYYASDRSYDHHHGLHRYNRYYGYKDW